MQSIEVPRERVERIVTLANRAPSGDNCQPWRFRWDGAALTIQHDAARARHAIDYHDHGSHLTLGCVLESIAVAAAAEGLAADAHLDLASAGETWAAVRFSPGASAPGELRDALELRATDRRLYRRGSIAHPVFAAVQQDARAFAGVGLYVIDRFGPELLRYLLAVDSYILRHEEVFRDTLRWVRLSDEEAAAHDDGVAWRTIGVEVPSMGATRLARHPWAYRLFDTLPVRGASHAWLGLQLASSAALWAVTVKPGRAEDLVAAGRLAMRAWLRFNRAGFGVQPLTLPALPVYNLACGGLPPTTRPEFVRLFEQGRSVVARAFDWPSSELPVWMFRVGLADPLPDRLRAPRRRTHEILTIDARSQPGSGSCVNL